MSHFGISAMKMLLSGEFGWSVQCGGGGVHGGRVPPAHLRGMLQNNEPLFIFFGLTNIQNNGIRNNELRDKESFFFGIKILTNLRNFE